jgi:hypothetical protein
MWNKNFFVLISTALIGILTFACSETQTTNKTNKRTAVIKPQADGSTKMHAFNVNLNNGFNLNSNDISIASVRGTFVGDGCVDIEGKQFSWVISGSSGIVYAPLECTSIVYAEVDIMRGGTLETVKFSDKPVENTGDNNDKFHFGINPVNGILSVYKSSDVVVSPPIAINVGDSSSAIDITISNEQLCDPSSPLEFLKRSSGSTLQAKLNINPTIAKGSHVFTSSSGGLLEVKPNGDHFVNYDFGPALAAANSNLLNLRESLKIQYGTASCEIKDMAISVERKVNGTEESPAGNPLEFDNPPDSDPLPTRSPTNDEDLASQSDGELDSGSNVEDSISNVSTVDTETTASTKSIETRSNSTSTINSIPLSIPKMYRSRGNHYVVGSGGDFCYVGRIVHIQDYARLSWDGVSGDHTGGLLRVNRTEKTVGDALTFLPTGLASINVLRDDESIPGALKDVGDCPEIGIFKYSVRGSDGNLTSTVKAAYGSANGYYCDLATFDDMYDYHRVFETLNKKTVEKYRDDRDSTFHQIKFTELDVGTAKSIGTCKRFPRRNIGSFGVDGKIYFASNDYRYCEISMTEGAAEFNKYMRTLTTDQVFINQLKDLLLNDAESRFYGHERFTGPCPAEPNNFYSNSRR